MKTFILFILFVNLALAERVDIFKTNFRQEPAQLFRTTATFKSGWKILETTRAVLIHSSGFGIGAETGRTILESPKFIPTVSGVFEYKLRNSFSNTFTFQAVDSNGNITKSINHTLAEHRNDFHRTFTLPDGTVKIRMILNISRYYTNWLREIIVKSNAPSANIVVNTSLNALETTQVATRGGNYTFSKTQLQEASRSLVKLQNGSLGITLRSNASRAGISNIGLFLREAYIYKYRKNLRENSPVGPVTAARLVSKKEAESDAQADNRYGYSLDEIERFAATIESSTYESFSYRVSMRIYGNNLPPINLVRAALPYFQE